MQKKENTMSNEAITVIYKWTAKPQMLNQLTQIYDQVAKAMQENEPGATAVHVFVSENDNAIYVRDEFADAAALGFHLSQTAAAHFSDLLEIAIPGQFQFFGDVPEDIQAATLQMGLQAEFATHRTGYDR
jgi:quinol monooxygenase YgiN